MGVDFLEKLVFALAVVAILLVAALVGVFSFFIQQSSGISHEEEVATIAVDDWLTKSRREAAGLGVQSNVILQAGAGVAVSPGGGASAGGQPGAGPAARPAAPGQPDNYIAKDGESIPQQEQVPGVPWLRRQEGVTYMRPEAVPQIVYERYQGFEEAWSVAQQGAGEFVDGKYRINWVDPSSLLATKIGLQAGDHIISVNGHPVAQSMSANRQLYESLKGQRQFAVKVLRNNQEVVLSFYVNN